MGKQLATILFCFSIFSFFLLKPEVVEAQTIERISVDSSEVEADGLSSRSSISSDGSLVAFESTSTNLVTGDTNGKIDIFLRDLSATTTTRVSVDSSEVEANGNSTHPSLAASGSHVAFCSSADNLVASDANQVSDVFIRDISAGTTERVSVDSAEVEADGNSGSPSVSSDGTKVVFSSDATNLVASDTNSVRDIFLRDRTAGTTIRVSVDSVGTQSDGKSDHPVISEDGAWIVFVSEATNLIASDTNAGPDVFLYEVSSGTTTRVSVTSAGLQTTAQEVGHPSLSQDGSIVAFFSDAPDLVTGDTNNTTDIFVYERLTGNTVRVSVNTAGVESNDRSSHSRVSNDGKFIIFHSKASNLVANDNNGVVDAFVHDRVNSRTKRLSERSDGSEAADGSLVCEMSINSDTVSLATFDPLLVEDANGFADVYTVPNPLVAPDITIVANDSTASETPTDNGQFTVSRTGDTDTAIVVNLQISGSAINGTDYTTISNQVTIPIGQSSATIDVIPADDSEVENLEDVSITLLPDPSYFVVSPSNASVLISDNDQFTVSINTTDSSSAESTLDTATFRFTRTGGTLGDLTVDYSLSGAAQSGLDYQALSGSVVILNGQSFVDVIVTPIDDNLYDPNEDVVITIDASASYVVGAPSNDSATIVDDEPVVTISATDANASETGLDKGTFELVRDQSFANPLTVNVNVTGSATSGIDYVALSTAVVIPAGQSTFSFDVTPFDDIEVENVEDIIVTIQSDPLYGVGGASNATVNLADDDEFVVSVNATDSIATEKTPADDTVTYVVSRIGGTLGSLNVNVAYSGTAVNGADYQSLSNTVTIPPGQVSTSVVLTPIDDAIIETNEMASLRVLDGVGYRLGLPSQATAVLIDNDTQTVPVISIEADDASAKEATPAVETGSFLIKRTGDLVGDLSVSLAVGGTAVEGQDYSSLPVSAVIPNGSSSVQVTVTPTDESDVENQETVIAAIQSGSGYLVNPKADIAEVVISDNEQANVFISTINREAFEQNGKVASFEVRRVGDIDSDLTVNFSVSGSASEGTDFSSLGGSVLVPAGKTSAIVKVNPILDSDLEENENVIISLSAGSGYSVGSESTAEAIVVDAILRVSVSSAGVEGNSRSVSPSVSADGTFVVFSSDASDLVVDDTNGKTDVFLRDTSSNQTTRVSVDSVGTELNGSSSDPVISGDGNYIAFASDATNLVSGDTNGVSDIFVVNRQTGAVERVSVASDTTQSDASSGRPVLSFDGRYVSFESFATNLVASDGNGFQDIFLHDRQTNLTTRLSEASGGGDTDGPSSNPSISNDGTLIAFDSVATNIVVSDSNGSSDVFLHDTQTGISTRKSVSSVGGEAIRGSKKPAISGDGTVVVFQSEANNLVDEDLNFSSDVFLHVVASGVTTRLSLNSDGNELNSSSFNSVVSSDGRFVAFLSLASNATASKKNCGVDAFIRDLNKRETQKVTIALSNDCNTFARELVLSSDGSRLGFSSFTKDFVAGDVNGVEDVFVAFNPFQNI